MIKSTVEGWPEQAIANKNQNKDFLIALKKGDKSTINQLLIKNHTEVFEKTDCLNCANCCKTTPPIVTKSDINRMAKFLNKSPQQIKRQYLIEDINGDSVFASVPCVFLETDNKCQIYDARPQACRRYPHTDESEYIYRVGLNLENTIICPAAFTILEKLKQNIIELSPKLTE